jgi:hypothetical protein
MAVSIPMAMIKIYRFAYYDPLLKHDRMSLDFATGDAIAERHGTIFAETERSVDEGIVRDDGTVRAADIPPREVAEEHRWVPPQGGSRSSRGSLPRS